MFHDRKANARLNKVFDKALRIACNDSGNNSENNSVNNYCNPYKSLTIHQRNLQLLMIEIFKTKNNLNPAFLKDIFAEKVAIIFCEIQIICNCR